MLSASYLNPIKKERNCQFHKHENICSPIDLGWDCLCVSLRPSQFVSLVIPTKGLMSNRCADLSNCSSLQQPAKVKIGAFKLALEGDQPQANLDQAVEVSSKMKASY